MSMQVLDTFLVYKLRFGNETEEDAINGSAGRLSCLDAPIATVVMCVTKRKTQRALCQKLYTHMFGRILKLVVYQLIGNVIVFVEYLTEDDVMIGPDGGVTKALRWLCSGK